MATPPISDGVSLSLDALRFAWPVTGQTVFDELTATLGPGLHLVRGGDGRGKTTLLRLLAGECLPQGGRIAWNAAPAAADTWWIDPRRDAHDELSPRQCWAEASARHPRWDASLLEALAGGLGLDEHADKALFKLSTGSRRKVWLAAALASGATLTLIDDPTAALDRPSIRFLAGALTQAAASGERVIVITGYEQPGDLDLTGVIDLGD